MLRTENINAELLHEFKKGRSMDYKTVLNLIKKGADLNVIDEDGRNCINIFQDYKNQYPDNDNLIKIQKMLNNMKDVNLPVFHEITPQTDCKMSCKY